MGTITPGGFTKVALLAEQPAGPRARHVATSQRTATGGPGRKPSSGKPSRHGAAVLQRVFRAAERTGGRVGGMSPAAAPTA